MDETLDGWTRKCERELIVGARNYFIEVAERERKKKKGINCGDHTRGFTLLGIYV